MKTKIEPDGRKKKTNAKQMEGGKGEVMQVYKYSRSLKLQMFRL